MKNDARVLSEYYRVDNNVINAVKRMVDLKLSELRNLARISKSSIRMFADVPLAVAGFDIKKCENMTYLELMGVLRHSQYSSAFNFKNPFEDINIYYDGVHITLDDNYLFYADKIAMFLNRVCDHSVPIRKFMALPVLRMCEVLESRLLWHKITSQYKELRRIGDDDLDLKALTVKDVIDACQRAESIVFLPEEPRECFCILKTSRMLEAVLLIESFAAIFPEAYDVNILREQYGVS